MPKMKKIADTTTLHTHTQAHTYTFTTLACKWRMVPTTKTACMYYVSVCVVKAEIVLCDFDVKML